MIDSTALFLHVLAAAGMIAGGFAQVLAGARVRSAIRAGSMREWVGFVRLAGLVILGSAFVSLATGGHMAGAVWTTEQSSGFSQPFITLGAVALVLLAPIGPMIGGRAFRGLLAEVPADAEGEVPASVRAAATSPRLWGAVHSLIGVSVGLVAIMTYKPSWAVSTVVLLVTFGIGWATGVAAARRGEAVAAEVR